MCGGGAGSAPFSALMSLKRWVRAVHWRDVYVKSGEKFKILKEYSFKTLPGITLKVGNYTQK